MGSNDIADGNRAQRLQKSIALGRSFRPDEASTPADRIGLRKSGEFLQFRFFSNHGSGRGQSRHGRIPGWFFDETRIHEYVDDCCAALESADDAWCGCFGIGFSIRSTIGHKLRRQFQLGCDGFHAGNPIRRVSVARKQSEYA
jgi:hypothetical protein